MVFKVNHGEILRKIITYFFKNVVVGNIKKTAVIKYNI